MSVDKKSGKGGGGGGDGGKSTAFPDYSAERDTFRNFASTFTDKSGEAVVLKQLQAVADRDSRVVTISLDDIAAQTGDPNFVANVERNTRAYQRIFSSVLDELMPAQSKDAESDWSDVSMTARIEQSKAVNAAAGGAAAGAAPAAASFPPELSRRYELRILPKSTFKQSKLRDVRSEMIGSLVKVHGIVTRVTDVQPLIRVCTYTCEECGSESYQTVDGKDFTPLKDCPSEVCKRNGIKGRLDTQTRASKFVKFQEIRLQEDSAEVPVGHIPRSITLHAFGEMTRQCTPGDMITVSGVFLPSPYAGFRAIRAGLTTDTYIEVMSLESSKKSVVESEMTADDKEDVETLANDKKVYEKMASSIAPEIYGQRDVKKAILLTLVGGVTRTLADLKIRGDINVLLMGDPGVAKSQLLKHVTRIAPRSVYTTGKGSSGVGLTAAVIRDPQTGEMSLEGGALVLADKGICCIDEFDKMEDGDKTAIHEVMEQQSVSIAKAGIITTLNARTAIIAAANPVFGRWNPRISAERNLGLPTALLSRFDLTFVILDEPNEENDEALARHITFVHMNNKAPKLEFDPIDPRVLRNYISRARTYSAHVPEDLTEYIVGTYVGLRQDSNNLSSGGNKNYQGNSQSEARQRFCTARTLLSILRLSQAMARLNFREVVTRDDVVEADRLLFESKRSANTKPEKKAIADDPTSAVFRIFQLYKKEMKTLDINVSDVAPKIARLGIPDDKLEETLEQYAELGLWTYTKKAGVRSVRFIDVDADTSASQ